MPNLGEMLGVRHTARALRDIFGAANPLFQSPLFEKINLPN